MNNFLTNQKRKILHLFIFLLTVGLILLLFNIIHGVIVSPSDSISVFISALEAMGLLISLIIAISQLSDTKEIARATFIIELNKSFVENTDYTSLYNKLQACFDEKCEVKQGDGACCDCMLSFNKSVISNYLTFFETIYILYKKGVISFDIIDDLFAYRFFIAVHSSYVQKMKLVCQPENFINIYRLEKEWLEYRVKIGKIDENRLKKAQSTTPDGNMSYYSNDIGKDVYINRTLKSLVSSEMYTRLTSDK